MPKPLEQKHPKKHTPGNETGVPGFFIAQGEYEHPGRLLAFIIVEKAGEPHYIQAKDRRIIGNTWAFVFHEHFKDVKKGTLFIVDTQAPTNVWVTKVKEATYTRSKDSTPPNISWPNGGESVSLNFFAYGISETMITATSATAPDGGSVTTEVPYQPGAFGNNFGASFSYERPQPSGANIDVTNAHGSDGASGLKVG